MNNKKIKLGYIYEAIAEDIEEGCLRTYLIPVEEYDDLKVGRVCVVTDVEDNTIFHISTSVIVENYRLVE